MTVPIETIYQDIGNTIVQSIPNEWMSAWIRAEVADETVYTLTGRYQQTADGPIHSFPVGESVARLFADLRGSLKKGGASSWRIATFTLKPDGEFELDFEY